MTRLATLLALLSAMPACANDPEPARPNALFIVLDTVRADRCSLYGYERLTTPNLDALASESTLYRDAWSPAGWTAPSHASMFTGLEPRRHGLYFGNRLFLPESFRTMAEILAATGYRTVGVSASPVVGPEFGLVQGFESFFSATAEEGAAPDDVYDLALKEIHAARDRGKSFFVYINDFRAHLPYSPTVESRQAFLPADATSEEVAEAETYDPQAAIYQFLGERTIPARQLEIMSALYDGEIRDADAALGRFIETLRADGGLDDTLLVVAADHGENLGDHGLTSHILSLHRSIRRVPLLIRFPGRFRQGAEVQELVRLEDLFPTVLEVCGEPVPGDIDGRSLLADPGGRISRAIHGRYDTSSVSIVGDQPRAGGSHRVIEHSLAAVFDGRLHLIRDLDGSEELYGVPADPREERNLAEDGAPEELRRHLPDVP